MRNLTGRSACSGLERTVVALASVGLAACSSGGGDQTAAPADPPRLVGDSTIRVEERIDDVVYTAQLDAGDRHDLVFSLEGEHADLFGINANTGAVRFTSAPLYNAAQPAENQYHLTVVVTDRQGNRDSKDIVAHVVNDYRLAFVVPAPNANVAAGSEDNVPVIVRVYEEDGERSNADISVTVNGQTLQQNPAAQDLWQGLIEVPAGGSELSAQASVAGETLTASRSIQNRITFTGAWALAYDSLRDRVIVPDALKQQLYSIDVETGDTRAEPLGVDVPSWVTVEMAYSEHLDRFYLSSLGIYAIDGELEHVQPLEVMPGGLTWGITFDELTHSLYYNAAFTEDAIYRLPQQNASETAAEKLPLDAEALGGSSDRHFDVDSERQRLFVANRSTREVEQINIAAGTRALLVDLSANFAFLGNIEYSEQTHRLYVVGVRKELESSVVEVNPADGSHRVLSGSDVLNASSDGAPVALVGSGPTLRDAYGLSLDSAGNRLFATGADGVLEISLDDGSRRWVSQTASQSDGVILGGSALQFPATGDDLRVFQGRAGTYFTLDPQQNNKTPISYPVVSDAQVYTYATVKISSDDDVAFVKIDDVWSPKESFDQYNYVFSMLDLQSNSTINELRTTTEGQLIDFTHVENATLALLKPGSNEGYQISLLNLENGHSHSLALPQAEQTPSELITSIAARKGEIFLLSRSREAADQAGNYRFSISLLDTTTGSYQPLTEFSGALSNSKLRLDYEEQADAFYVLGLPQAIIRSSVASGETTTLAIDQPLAAPVTDIQRDPSGQFYWLLTDSGAVYQYALGRAVLVTN